MRTLLGCLVALSLLASACGGTPTAAAAGDHPRLIVRQSDVGRLRSWAVSSNPLWSQGLVPLAKRSRRWMDKGRIPNKDLGGTQYEPYPVEMNAELFAFMSMVDPDPAKRADWGKRARKVLMYGLRKAAKGRKANKPFRDVLFSTGNRSRFYGEGWPLTVDWAYSYFTAADKKIIRKVFLRWAREQYTGYPLNNLTGELPKRGRPAKDPALIADRHNVRWALNNFYLAHPRNLGMMAMALDPADDPGDKLRGQVKDVVGQWLFLMDHALRTEGIGGLSPEGFEYGPDATGRLAQLLVALRTAGDDGSSDPLARIDSNPFWKQAIVGYLESLPPVPTTPGGDLAYIGQIWQAASYGDEENYQALDPTTLFAPIGIDAAAGGDTAIPEAARWIAKNVPAGGPEGLVTRVGNTDGYYGSILSFLLFDPAAGEPKDPRPALPLRYVAASLQRTLARTCWCADGRMFTHKLSYNEIDHQVGDGNDFGLFRKGEWLTKSRAGYDSQQVEGNNIVYIQNDKPKDASSPDTYSYSIWKTGGQTILIPAGEPKLVARSMNDRYVAITGDATNLYNSTYEESTDVVHASRSIVWLEPDHIVAYDRVTTKKADRFKRFWLQAPAKPQVDGKRATVQTPKGQQLFLTTLLPEDATLTATKHSDTLGTPAAGEPMTFHIKVEAPGGPADARFLNVIQGADGGAAADAATKVRSTGGAAYDGAVVAGRAVLFPVQMTGGGPTTVPLPAGVAKALVTGLRPGGKYAASISGGSLSVTDGGSLTADEGGVLEIGG